MEVQITLNTDEAKVFRIILEHLLEQRQQAITFSEIFGGNISETEDDYFDDVITEMWSKFDVVRDGGR